MHIFYYKNHKIPAVLAITAEEQQRGLMGNPSPPPLTAFVYKESRSNKFWMHKTPAPLDIIFCHRGKISQICYGEPYSTRIIGDDSPSDLVVEMPHGSATKMGMKVGDDILLQLDTH